MFGTGNSIALVAALVGAAIVFMGYRQFVRRPVGPWRRLMVIPGVLVVWGLLNLAHSPGLNSFDLILTVVEVAVGLFLGVLRGMTMRTWREPDGVLWQSGSWQLAVLWVISIVARLGLSFGAGKLGVSQSISLAEIPLFFGASLLVQNLYLLSRVNRAQAAGGGPGVASGRTG